MAAHARVHDFHRDGGPAFPEPVHTGCEFTRGFAVQRHDTHVGVGHLNTRDPGVQTGPFQTFPQCVGQRQIGGRVSADHLKGAHHCPQVHPAFGLDHPKGATLGHQHGHLACASAHLGQMRGSKLGRFTPDGLRMLRDKVGAVQHVHLDALTPPDAVFTRAQHIHDASLAEQQRALALGQGQPGDPQQSFNHPQHCLSPSCGCHQCRKAISF